MNSKTFSLGRAFTLQVIGLYSIIVLLTIPAMIYGNLLMRLGSIPFILFFILLIFTSKQIHLQSDFAKFHHSYHLFGMVHKSELREFNEAKALVIRFKRLSDRKPMMGRSSWGMSRPMGSLGVLVGGHASVTYNTAWFITAAYSTNKTQLLMISNKEDAFEFVNKMVETRGLEIYSGYFKRDRKLNRDQLKLGKLVFQKTPKIISTRR
jgi:hypothetical protein